jgi:hypothetical protein
MCSNAHQTTIDIETLTGEFHEIKHMLAHLNESVETIAGSLKLIEQQHADESGQPVSG